MWDAIGSGLGEDPRRGYVQQLGGALGVQE
jgi:hypothetical protein